jgi:hypothetical protein
MKKIVLIAAVLVLSASVASAQFAKGDAFLSGNVTGLDFSRSSLDGYSVTNLGLQAAGGYFLSDVIALEATLGGNFIKAKDVKANKSFTYGIGARAYATENFFAGVGLRGIKDDGNNLYLGIQAGYDYFISEKVFFEPALYFQKGLSKIDKSNTFGLKLGIGVKF